MMSNNHKHSGCGYGEELVAYLYGEANAAESAAFESHLAGCSICADELAAFSGVKFSISDWKSKEFAGLATPFVEVPFEPTLDARQKVIGAESSWRAALGALFSKTSRAWSLATASAAVVAVGVGIVLFGLNSQKDDDRAGAEKNTKIASAPTIEKSPEQPKTGNNQNNLLPSEEKSTDRKISSAPKAAAAIDATNKPAVKVINNRRAESRAENNAPQNKNPKRDDKNKTPAPPKIIEDDEEDDTLRLAELFEEIDTIE